MSEWKRKSGERFGNCKSLKATGSAIRRRIYAATTTNGYTVSKSATLDKPTIDELYRAVEAWSATGNEKLKGIQWHLNVEKARAKLKSLYPIIE